MTHDCWQIRDVLDSYLSGELLVETNHAVLEHVARCGACAAELERRQTLVALLRHGQPATPDVVDLRRRIGAAIDREQHWWTRAARRWAVAATVLLAAAVMSWYLVGGVAVDAAAIPDSLGDHVECALTTPPNAIYDAVRVARRLPPQFAALAERFLAGTGSYRLVDAHACPYKGRRYAHFVFRGNGRTMSLFLDDHPHGALPEVASADEGNFHVDASATSHHQLFVVSDRGEPEAETLVRDVLAPSVAFVSDMERRQPR